MAVTVSKQLAGAPTQIKVGAYAAAVGDCTDVGGSGGPVLINYSTEHHDIKCDQLMGVTAKILTGRKVTVVIPLAEATLENFALAMGYPTTAVATNTLSVGGASTVTNRTIYIYAPDNVAGATRLITLHKCVVIGAVEYGMNKDGDTLYKVEVEVLQDTAQATGEEYYTIVRSGTDTTAPTVAFTSPGEDGTVATGSSTALTFTFTEAGTGMDESTIVLGETVFVNDVDDVAATIAKAGTLTYNAATKILTFTPTAAWHAVAAHNYSVMFSTGIKDIAGNKLAAVNYFHFVTV